MTDYQVNTGDHDLDLKIRQWLAWDKNEKTLQEIKDMVSSGQVDGLKKILMRRLKFGTAGLRGMMGAGFNAMNDLVLIQTGQGLIKYLEDHDANHLRRSGIVIGYDGRHNSKRFAELTATIFLNKGYPVRLFSEMVPTPFIPFTVAKYKCLMGVMITASHNPKEDNGYKVYAANGSQIISPADVNIQTKILENLDPLEESWATIEETLSRAIDPLDEVLKSYVEMVSNNILAEHKIINNKTDVQFVYTPMHGVGYPFVQKIMDAIGLKIVVVPEQKDSHPDFPTVKLPNPEEGKNALDLSIATADKNGIPIILANDPDADRLACAEKNQSTGEWKIFNGNELGALLGWWALECYQTNPANKEPLQNVFMLASTVSSKILRTMAIQHGFNFLETLTGFKWMGNKAYSLSKAGQKTIFAFEEAIGFMWGDDVLDKDGVQAAAQLATMAVYLKTKNLTLNDQLETIFQKYGYHLSLNSYFLCYEPEVVAQIFKRLRNFNRETRYPSSIGNGKYHIAHVRDLTIGYDDSRENKKAIWPAQSDSQMITFEFENGLVATLRTSGTEPKLKYYTELVAKPGQGNRQEIEELLTEMAEKMNEEFLEPQKNGLKLPPT